MRAWLLVLVVGCGGSPSAPKATPPAATPVEPEVKNNPFPPVPPPEPALPDPPEVEPAVGAMPVPPEEPSPDDPFADWFTNPPIEVVDTTITEAQLPRADLRWKKRVRVERGGEVMLVLRVDRWTDGGIYLSVVEDETGIHEEWKLGSSDDTVGNPWDGTSFRPWRDEDNQPRSEGILFAARIHPRGSRVQHQFVVYCHGESVMVVQRKLGATIWKRTLRLDFEPGATFHPIGTSNPH